jgi:MFS family permease
VGVGGMSSGGMHVVMAGRDAPRTAHHGARVNTPRQVLFASLVGTTIEFFDFYIYGTAAVLVFPALFFSASDPAWAQLASFATFGIAFVARPIGSAIFGHFPPKVRRHVCNDVVPARTWIRRALPGRT